MEGVTGVDYSSWELERQRAALWALLGGGKTEGGEAEEHTVWERETPSHGKRRSPAAPETAWESAVFRKAGRYAGGPRPEEAGGPPVGAPGAWEMVREAEEDRSGSESGALGIPVSAWESFQGQETRAPVRGGRRAEADVLTPSRREEEIRRTPRIGTGGAAGSPEPFGGPGAREALRETADTRTAEPAAELAGGRDSEKDSAGRRYAGEADGSPQEKPVGGKTIGDFFAVTGRSGTALSGGDGLSEAAGRGERLSRALPWGGGWESAALRAEDGARSLSRAVQRDARRYDGGFTIY